VRGHGHGRAADHGFLGVVASVVAVSALVGAPTAEAADAGANVTIVSPGQPEVRKDLSAEAVDAMRDVRPASYTLGCPSPDPTKPCTTEAYGGLSAASFAAAVGVAGKNVGRIEVSTAVASAYATGDEVRDGFTDDPALDGQPHPALFRVRNAGQVSFLRPYRRATNDSQDVNPGAGEPLAVRITTVEGLVGVAVSAPQNAAPDQPIELTARSTGSSSRVARVTWAFGDGESADTTTVSHAWGATGSYIVRATLETEDGRSGVGQATIQVGTPTPAPTDTTPATGAPDGSGTGATSGGGTGQPGAPATGSAEGVGSGAGVPVPDAGGANPTGSQARPGGSRTATDDATRPGRKDASGGRQRPRSTTTDTSTTRPPSAAGGGPTSSGSARSAMPNRSAGRTKDRRGRSPSTGDGSISGVLVTSRAAAVVPASPAEVAAAAAARRGAEPRDTSDLTWILGPLAVVLLLGLGVAREVRPRRRAVVAGRMPTT
jgi:hypothetical protein